MGREVLDRHHDVERLGFRGDYYSVLILGEQTPLAHRGVQMKNGSRPSLNWHVTPDELASYEGSVNKFFAEYADELEVVYTRVWERLLDLDLYVLAMMMRWLCITKPIVMAS